LQLLADTGNPCAVILGEAAMKDLKRRAAPDLGSNFGALEGGWIRIVMPELRLDQEIIGYASNEVMIAAQASSPEFQGLAGLPLLRLLEYGGDAEFFWIRMAIA
jgi:hypothetical protein